MPAPPSAQAPTHPPETWLTPPHPTARMHSLLHSLRHSFLPPTIAQNKPVNPAFSGRYGLDQLRPLGPVGIDAHIHPMAAQNPLGTRLHQHRRPMPRLAQP